MCRLAGRRLQDRAPGDDAVIRAVTLVGFAVIAGTAIALQAYSVRTRGTASIGDLVGRVIRPPGGRVVFMVAWLWLGWHVFVRVSL